MAMNHLLTLQNFELFAIIWDWACNQLPGYPQSNGRVENTVKTAKSLIKKAKASGPIIFFLYWAGERPQQRGWAPCQLRVCFGNVREPTFKDLSPLVKRETVRANVMPLLHDKSQTWFKAKIEELADVRSYKVKTEDGRILGRNRRHLCRSREPFCSSRPSETPVALQPLDMAASQEKLQGPEPTEGQSFPTVPAQEDQSKQTTKTPVAIPSKAQPLCTTLNKSQLVENKITRAHGRLSKPPGYLKDYAWLHLMIAGDSWKIGFFLFFFLA